MRTNLTCRAMLAGLVVCGLAIVGMADQLWRDKVEGTAANKGRVSIRNRADYQPAHLDDTFTLLPDARYDVAIISKPSQATSIEWKAGAPYKNPIEDQAIFFELRSRDADDCPPSIPAGAVVARIEGRDGIGGKFWLEVVPTLEVAPREGTGGGGTAARDWWGIDIGDLASPSALVLRDMFTPDQGYAQPELRATGNDYVPTLFAHASRTSPYVGTVNFSILEPQGEASYVWTINVHSDDSKVCSSSDPGWSPLTAANDYSAGVTNLAVGYYYLKTTQSGNGNIRRIDFVVYRLQVIHAGLNDREFEFGDILGQTVGEGITRDPAMPRVKIKFLPALPNTDTGFWFETLYDRPDRNDKFVVPVPGIVPANVLTGQWCDPIPNMPEGQMTGGLATIRCWRGPIGSTWPDYTKVADDFRVHLRGENPTEASAKARLTQEGAPWFAYAIAKRESGTQNGRSYLQFKEIGSIGPDFRENVKYLPNREDVAETAPQIGWGIMQLTTLLGGAKPTIDQLWNWKANIDGGLSFIKDVCLGKANGAHDCAAWWINRQETQQAQQDPQQPLANETFTWNGIAFKKNTARTPLDACTIQRYNGAALWVIFWQQPTQDEGGYWVGRGQDGQQASAYAAYLKDVLDKLETE